MGLVCDTAIFAENVPYVDPSAQQMIGDELPMAISRVHSR